jgi:glycosyltransferase involved in cell wall biosynthesis
MSNKSRILFITHFFPPTHNAGTENYTLGIAKAFQKRGFDVEVLCAEDWDIGDSYWNGISVDDYEGVAVRRIHLNWKKARDPNKVLYDSKQVELWLDGYLAENKFDLVHVTSTYSLGVGVLRSVNHARIPLVLTLTDFWFICPSHQLYRSDESLCDGDTTAWECNKCLLANSQLFQQYNHLKFSDPINEKIWGTLSHIPVISKRRGLRGMLLDMVQRKYLLSEVILLPDVIISPSMTVQKFVGQNLSVPIILLPHGHDLSWLDYCCDPSTHEKLRIGYIGQIQKTKGVHLLIEAYLKANLEGKANLDIWGDLNVNSAYVKQLKELIGGIGSIKLRGRFDHNRLGDILSDIDILVVPSLWYENSPLVISEAFATKTPVITANLGGMAEVVVDGVNGLLFSPGDAMDLARNLSRIIKEPGLLDILRKRIKPVKTIDKEVDELKSIYENLIRNKL